MNLLTNYNSRAGIYSELWRKFSKEKKPASDAPAPKVKTQEDSIKWSLKLQDALNKKVQKTGHTFTDIKKEFTSGCAAFIPSLYPELTRVHWALAKVNLFIRASELDLDGLLIAPEAQDIEEAKKEVTAAGLDFDFDNLDELFLEGEEEGEKEY